MYIYIDALYACMHVHMYSAYDLADQGEEHLYLFMIMHVYICIYIDAYVCIHVFLHMIWQVRCLLKSRSVMYVCMYVCMCLCMYIHELSQTSKHTHTYKYIHAPKNNAYLPVAFTHVCSRIFTRACCWRLVHKCPCNRAALSAFLLFPILYACVLVYVCMHVIYIMYVAIFMTGLYTIVVACTQVLVPYHNVERCRAAYHHTHTHTHIYSNTVHTYIHT